MTSLLERFTAAHRQKRNLMSDGPRVVLWQGLLRPGAEWCEFAREEQGWRLSGTALIAVDDDPFMVTYQIALDPGWATRDVEVTVRGGADDGERRLHLHADHGQRWRGERKPAPGGEMSSDDLDAVRGLFDIDLGFSPATNTLPVRRLAPEIGAAVDVTALWVRFPELTIEPLPQRYTRLGERRYRYESADGAFIAEIEVDDLGIVVTYEGGWQRIAAT